MKIDRDGFLATAIALSAACGACGSNKRPPPRVAAPPAYGYPQQGTYPPQPYPQPYSQHGYPQVCRQQPCAAPPWPSFEGMPPPQWEGGWYPWPAHE